MRGAHRRVRLSGPRAAAPAGADVGALLVARERGGADPEHGAHGAGEGQLRVLGPDHAGARVPARVPAGARREPGPGQARGAGADREWRWGHAPEWVVEWAELGRGGAQARGRA